jgi:ComF family protein
MQITRSSLSSIIDQLQEWHRRLPTLTAKLLQELLWFVFPPACAGCARLLCTSTEESFCPECQKTVDLVQSPFCPVCGLPFSAETADSHLCGDCLTGAYYFDRARAAGLYRRAIREVLNRFKYDGQLFLVRPLASMLISPATELLASHRVELIVPVPLHRRRLRQRGFNQAALLARRLGSILKLPVDYSSLKRSRWTEPQTGLSRRQRVKNVKGAFHLQRSEKVQGKCVLLLDDVFTTGETVNQCSRTLKDAGARGVLVLTVARTVG